MQDEKLVQEIIKRDMALTVCPLVKQEPCRLSLTYIDHPLKKMMEIGMKVTVNSDDPAYFGGQVNQNFIEIQKALIFLKKTFTSLREILLNSPCWMKTRMKYLNELDDFYARTNKLYCLFKNRYGFNGFLYMPCCF